MKKTITAILMTCVFAATMLTGCQTAQPEPSAPATPAAPAPAAEAPAAPAAPAPADPAVQQKGTIGISADDYASSYWIACIDGAANKAKELGYEVDIQVASGDPNLQNKQIEDMLARGVQAIICAANDSTTIVQAVKKCNEMNVPFVYLDRVVESTDDAKVSWGSGTDNTALAQSAMEWMGEYARENGVQLNILELTGYLGDPNSVARMDGVANAVSNYSDVMTHVKKVPTENDIEKTLAGTTNALQENPDINCIFMVADYFLDATISALKQTDRFVKAGEEKCVYIVTFDGAAVSVTNIKDGYVMACGVQDCGGIGANCADAADKLINGIDPGPFEKNPGFVLSADNFDEMAPRAFGWADSGL